MSSYLPRLFCLILFVFPLYALVVERYVLAATSNAMCTALRRPTRSHLVSSAARFGYFYPKDIVRLELVAVRPFDACGHFQNDVAGKVALVQRGNCNFAHKVLQAQNAHAKAVVVMDDAHRENNTWLVQMVGDPGNASHVTIPSVFVSHAIGLRLVDKIDAMKLADMTMLVTLNSTGQITFQQKSNEIARQNIILVLVGCVLLRISLVVVSCVTSILTILLAHWLRIAT
ncbi:Aste57867_22869 [Aphanomyces stellatus]|uniref:Aste57867_22869 protein n=1 Tax=Aphanomyces stellatus TaxID=120398 RepID=A0A485LL32_9STRA|nr:hypothetical protein As57867_022798 [Aphanomyces stellatus]VFT99519.1 Aste57867_22869 [Aphanomyces stellatus]